MNIIEELLNNKTKLNDSYFDPNFIKKNGALNKNNYMNYFMESSFYDMKSINQQCFEEKKKFKDFHEKKTGIEYIKQKPINDNIFIIKEYFRKKINNKSDKTEAIFTGIYYIFNGVIYKSPDIYTVVSNDIQNISNNMLNIISFLNNNENDKLTEYNL